MEKNKKNLKELKSELNKLFVINEHIRAYCLLLKRELNFERSEKVFLEGLEKEIGAAGVAMSKIYFTMEKMEW